jgi:mevalonate kinase
MQPYYSNGKLLLTGEYVVLDGALALAVPTKFGQSLTVEPISDKLIKWTSLDYNKTIWYKNTFSFDKGEFNSENNNQTSLMLLKVFEAIKKLKPTFFNTNKGFNITTELNFPQNWGLGSSSTLINNIANWVNVDAYKLLNLTFGGSGYDIACASHNSPITYLKKQSERFIKEVNFNPNFSDQLFFVHLNQKQNSREGIEHYNLNKGNIAKEIKEISSITLKMIISTTLDEFEKLIQKHELIISKITKQETVKSRLFDDYTFGSIKSLGAWGGDFVLVTGTKENMRYFESKGYKTILAFKNMVL